jgi:hypothetical protein
MGITDYGYAGAGISIGYSGSSRYLYLVDQYLARIYVLDASMVPTFGPTALTWAYAYGNNYLPWGAGMDNEPQMWWGDVGWGYSTMLWEVQAYPPWMVFTGSSFDAYYVCDTLYYWEADISDNKSGDTLFFVNVGHTNHVYGVQEPSGMCVREIGDPTWDWVSQRALAWNNDDGTFFIGGWNVQTMWEIDPINGTPIPGRSFRSCNPSGAAYQDIAHGGPYLYVQTNDSPDILKIYNVPMLLRDDIAVTDIPGPECLCISSDPFAIKGNISNIGTQGQSFDTWCEITWATGSWTSSVITTSLSAFSSSQYTYGLFPNGLPDSTELQICVYVTNPGDQDVANDRLCVNYHVRRPCEEYITDNGSGGELVEKSPPYVLAKKMEMKDTKDPVSLVCAWVNTVSKGEPFYPWPDCYYDPIRLSAWCDEDDDGVPDAEPTWTAVVTPSDLPHWIGTYIPTCSFTCPFGKLWVGMEEILPGREGLTADPAPPVHSDCWYFDGGAWHQGNLGVGDWHIRGCLERCASYAPKWFCKVSYPDYAPSGVADFDQKQEPQIKDKWVHCGPTAVANSIWWLDSKFESQRNPNPIPPPAISDNHPLVQAYGPWDDHDPRNVDSLIKDLSEFMGTDSLGTEIHAMERGIDDFLQYYCAVCVHETTYTKPTFEEVRAEVKKSEDVILLLGFWKGQSRIGGHYVTVSCVDTLTRTIKINDPYFDWETHPPFEFDITKHNDALNVSRDIYTVDTSTTPGAVWGLADYLDGKQNYVSTFFGQNVPDSLKRYQAPSYQVPTHVAVEYAVAISPCEGNGQQCVADLDIEDNRGSLSANTMQAFIGPPTSPYSIGIYEIGRFNMVNPDQVANNVDLYDGPGNVDLSNLSWNATQLSDPYDMFKIGPPGLLFSPLPGILPSGAAAYHHVYIWIYYGTPFDYTFTGTASVSAVGCDSSVADTFTIKVTTTATGGPTLASFLGGAGEQANLLKWENFNLGQVGFNLYRRVTDWEGFTKLNSVVLPESEYRDPYVAPGLDYEYSLGAVMEDGSEMHIGPMFIRTQVPMPKVFALDQNAPNPFSDRTSIGYQVPSAGRVSLKMYDLSGRFVRTLVDEEKTAGVHSVVWSGDDAGCRMVSSGVYIAKLTSDGKTQTRKIMVVR